jgi:predicted Fe-Mo cluster-binding NifX family protein
MKVCFPTDDGLVISRHFGQALYFKVFTLENNQAASVELRLKAHHSHGEHEPEHAQGMHPGQLMFQAIADCQVLICGGMGMPAYNRALAAGMEVFLTPETSIDEALKAYQAGTLVSELGLMHDHQG